MRTTMGHSAPTRWRWTVAAIVTSLPLVAFGQAQEELTEASKKVLQEAADAADHKDWGVCRTKAAGVWDKFKRPSVASLLGACEAELGMNREAAEHLDFFLQRDDHTRPNQTKAAADRFPAVRSKVHLVVVTCEPAAASECELRVDGALKSITSSRLFLEPGRHQVQAARDGSASSSETVDAVPGGQSALSLRLSQAAASSGGAGGSGISSGSGGGGGTGGPGGAGPTAQKPIWPYPVFGAVGAAGLGLGIAGIVLAESKHGDASDLKCGHDATCQHKGDELLSSGNKFRGMAGGGFALLGAAGLGALIYAVIPAKAEPRSGLIVVPVATGGTYGAWVSTSF